MGRVLGKISNTNLFYALRRGLMLTYPIVMIGCFACVLGNIPIAPYLAFIESFMDGVIKSFFDIINTCCIGFIALWMSILIAYSYGEGVEENPDRAKANAILYPVVSLCCYILIVYDQKSPAAFIGMFSSKWVFTALVTTLTSCFCLRNLIKIFGQKHLHIYCYGADSVFIMVIRHLLPAALTIAFYAFLRILFLNFFSSTDFYNAGNIAALKALSHVNNEYLSGLLFNLGVHLFWFFGIHGSDMLENVAFAFQAKLGSDAIVTKTFNDVFVLMGGCGVSLCIIIAIFLVGRASKNRNLAKLSVFPGLFNVNETMIYGLPLFFNGLLFIPFLLTPAVIYSVSYLASAFGLVPIVNHEVTWQMPVFFSGYVATGSVNGIILQAINLCIGISIYIPFIKKLEQKQKKEFRDNIMAITEEMQLAEKDGRVPKLISRNDVIGETAKSLANDLNYSMDKNKSVPDLFFQPQMNFDKTPEGMEALLRWKHPIAGYIYPPLIIALAIEMHKNNELGFYIIDKACERLGQLAALTDKSLKISVNITASQLKNPQFAQTVKEILSKYNFGSCRLIFELTEQISLSSNPVVNSQLDALKSFGIELSLDDFGMGHSSLIYLQDHKFSYVKLDGCLVKNIETNPTSQKIVTSIVEFAKKTNIRLIAEYVENESQTKLLHSYGCDCYQGYYYAKALPFDEAVQYLQENSKATEKCL